MEQPDHRLVASRFFEALAGSDLESLIAVMHPEIVWEVPGQSPVSGRFEGLSAAGDMMVRIDAMAGGNVKISTRELFVNNDGVVALVDVDLAPEGEPPWQGEDAWLVRTDGSQVTHIREHWFDTRGFDELQAWRPAT
jgi:ketosteroid isomerase-like protein